MSIGMVLAIGQNGEVGEGDEMPWGLEQKDDLANFKKITSGGVVIMGRKSHESIIKALGKTLPGRVSIVISRGPDHIDGVITTNSIINACEIANKQTTPSFIIGGASIFKQSIDYVDQIFLTVVGGEFNTADTYFDKSLLSDFYLSSRKNFPADERNKFPYQFEIWRRLN